jgi:CRISPR-associated protein Csm5
MKRYRLTVLTPLLVGDGQKLSPIDYMVWRDQVNVLDQRKIFRLLSKSARMDSYLSQLRKVQKLDFASWGGYAQNYALRRIPLEHPSLAEYYDRARAEDLFIPTFASTTGGIYLPATALKGPLRTALLAQRATEAQLSEAAARLAGERLPRRPAELLETAVLGPANVSRTRSLIISDSQTVPYSLTRLYLLRTATLVRKGDRVECGWRTSPRGSVSFDRVKDSTPVFAEMAPPGTVFEGDWGEPAALQKPELLQALRWKEPAGAAQFAAAANLLAERLLAIQKAYAEQAGLRIVGMSVDALTRRLAELRALGNACLLNIGWGNGLLAKTAVLDNDAARLREMLRDHPLYSSAIRTGMAFPKTRKIVFMSDRPATLPGWVQLQFEV